MKKGNNIGECTYESSIWFNAIVCNCRRGYVTETDGKAYDNQTGRLERQPIQNAHNQRKISTI